MTEDADESRDPIYWERRIEQTTDEYDRLFGFVDEGVRTGRVSKEASKAFFDASLDAKRRAGLLDLLLQRDPRVMEGGSDRAMTCTVFEQSVHEGRQALLRVQPELKEALDREAPPSGRGGHSL
jgi:hypothetical protein